MSGPAYIGPVTGFRMCCDECQHDGALRPTEEQAREDAAAHNSIVHEHDDSTMRRG